jgi:hypothetical protein
MTVTWSMPTVAKSDIGCYCSLCDDLLLAGESICDHEVWKCGELAYIELAHEKCAALWPHIEAIHEDRARDAQKRYEAEHP